LETGNSVFTALSGLEKITPWTSQIASAFAWKEAGDAFPAKPQGNYVALKQV
jgi:hypothetical protein